MKIIDGKMFESVSFFNVDVFASNDTINTWFILLVMKLQLNSFTFINIISVGRDNGNSWTKWFCLKNSLPWWKVVYIRIHRSYVYNCTVCIFVFSAILRNKNYLPKLQAILKARTDQSFWESFCRGSYSISTLVCL